MSLLHHSLRWLGLAVLLQSVLGWAASAAPPKTLGDLQTISCAGAVCDVVARVGATTDTAPLRVSFWGPSVVRYWLAVDGNFSNTGCADDVIVGTAQPVVVVQRDAGAFVELSQAAAPTPNVVVRLNKSPLLLSIWVDGAPVVQEASPLSWNTSDSWQTLARDAAPLPTGLTREHFFGGGMQNGRFAHRDETIQIAVGYDWADGGHPNPVPWFVSSAGYGVFRNTWAAGLYSFASPVVTSHSEPTRVDAFFMLAGAGPDSIKTLLGLYTALTGPPFLPPLYAFFLGDSDCYHNDRHGNSTQVAVAVAKLYEQYDMPRGWCVVSARCFMGARALL